MNKLEEEKRLVAEWMKWCVMPNGWIWDNQIFIEFFNPKDDRNAWPELFEKMNDNDVIRQNYKFHLAQLLGHWSLWDFHTAPPELCWKALIITIKEMKQQRTNNQKEDKCPKQNT